MVLFPLKTWNRWLNVVLQIKQCQWLVKFILFSYISDNYFTIKFKNILQIIRNFWSSWYRCYVTHDWPLWITCTLRYTHIHICPYCVYVWVFPLYWKVMKDTMHHLCVFCWSEIKYFSNLAHGMKCVALLLFHKFGYIISWTFTQASTILKFFILLLELLKSIQITVWFDDWFIYQKVNHAG